MPDVALPAMFVVFTWWSSTGAILFVDSLPPRTFRFSLTAVGLLAAAALCGLFASSAIASPGAAYVSFGCSLAVWAWHELSFLTGFVTGPRKVACPAEARGWQRFVYATSAVIHHELALAATLALIAALTWNRPNQVGTWTFLVLWAMRLSAKVNLFLGVRNITENFIPDHLRYLLSYFRRARLNPLMPFSIVIAGAVVVRLSGQALADGAGPFVLVSRTLVATILALAVMEHLFLILPSPDAVLWSWAVRRAPEKKPCKKLGEAK